MGKSFHALPARFAILVSVVLVVFSAAAQKTTSVRGDKTEGSARSGLVDINRASVSELKTLPGIRDAYAAAIVKNRPYKNKTQLLSKQIIPEAAYANIRNKIIARQ